MLLGCSCVLLWECGAHEYIAVGNFDGGWLESTKISPVSTCQATGAINFKGVAVMTIELDDGAGAVPSSGIVATLVLDVTSVTNTYRPVRGREWRLRSSAAW